MKKSLLILTVILAFAAGGIYYASGRQPAETPVPTPSVTVGITPSVTPAPMDDTEEIKQALYKKNSWPEGSVTVSVSSNDGVYAKGMVNGQGGGGLFFAAKTGGVWKIVADGNGIISCDSLKDYPDYPATLIPQCYDAASSQLIKR